MERVRNKRDLQRGYSTIRMFEELIAEHRHEISEDKIEILKGKIAETKREMRRFLKERTDRRIVKDYGIDGYVLLIQLPETLENQQDAEEYFEENERMYATPSMYDCTGQAFTSWFKVFRRRDRFMAYHSIGFDV